MISFLILVQILFVITLKGKCYRGQESLTEGEHSVRLNSSH